MPFSAGNTLKLYRKESAMKQLNKIKAVISQPFQHIIKPNAKPSPKVYAQAHFRKRPWYCIAKIFSFSAGKSFFNFIGSGGRCGAT